MCFGINSEPRRFAKARGRLCRPSLNITAVQLVPRSMLRRCGGDPMSELAIALPRELMARVAKWATEHQLRAPEALVQLIERGLSTPPESAPRGHPVHWGDARYMLLEGLVFQIKRELEQKNGLGKPRVSNEQAIKTLRKRYPANWGVYEQETLVTRFYDARQRLREIHGDLERHFAATTGNRD
jgi:hypothetical protein